jgi:tetratricopeptide (TPR) repeat protein
VRMQGLGRVAACLAAAVVPVWAAAAADPWVEVRSPHMVVVSDAGKGVARRVAVRFERFRAAIKVIWPFARVDPPIPPLILAPRGEEGLKSLLPEYWEQKGAMHPAGVFVGDSIRPWIAVRADLADLGPEVTNPFQVIQHEYVHLVIRLNFERVPAWLNEGMAELLGGVTVRGDGIVLGAPLEHHLHLLREREPMPVERLFQIDYRSPEYSERDRANLFYAESWALAHYLVLDPKASRDARYKGFVSKVIDGMEPRAALRAEGLETAEIDRALQLYVRQLVYRGSSRATRIETAGGFPARDLSEAEWLAVCGAFLVHRGRPVEARSLLDQAERRQPDLPALRRARGLALYREERLDEAREELERAARAEPSDAVGRLLAAMVSQQTASTADARAVARSQLESALELAPEHPLAHRLLAETLLAQGEVPAAVDHALRAARLEPGSGQHRLTLARAFAAAGQVSEARAQAAKAAALGLDEVGSAAGFELLRTLAGGGQPGPTPGEPAEPSGASPVPPAIAPSGERATTWGVFVDMEGGSRLSEHGDRVEIGVPAGIHDLSAELGMVNAPRVLRPAEGDFAAEVTVSRAPQPDDRPLHEDATDLRGRGRLRGRQLGRAQPALRDPALPGRPPFNGAGLLLWQDARNYIRLEAAAYMARGVTVRFALFEHRRSGVPVHGIANTRTRLAAAPTRLRLERRGRTLLGFARQGSDDWIEVGRFEADLPSTVYVGVAAVNASQAPFTAEFEGFTVAPIP